MEGCYKRFVGAEMIQAVNLAKICGGGDWPVPGGLFNQSAWFINVYQTLMADEARIQQDQAGR